MGYAENMRVLSNINCGLASAVNYAQMRSDGATPAQAGVGLFTNLSNGYMRNEIAYQMQRMGNPVGNAINLYAGYGNPVSNAIGTLGIMSACSPRMFWNSPCCCTPMMPMVPMTPMFGGFGSYSYSYSRSISYFC